MSKAFALTFVVALLVIGGVVWFLYYQQRGAHIDPKGSILKVRTIKLDDKDSAAIVELRLANDADYDVVARTIEATAITPNGKVAGNVVAEVDVKDLYKNFPELGEQFNPVLKARDKVPPHGSIDREVVAQFTMPVGDLDQRKDLVVEVQDITGPTVEMHEKKK